MSSNIFKISAVAATIAASFGANAALYNVYEYSPAAGGDVYGSAIQSSADDCWSSAGGSGVDCTLNHTANHKIAYEEQFAPQGFSYREELPFLFDSGYEYVLEDGFSGFENYCRSFLDYSDSICSQWATRQYTQGYALEGAGYNNSNAFVEGVAVRNTDDSVVINDFDTGAANALGTYYGGSLTNRSVAFIGGTPLGLGTGDQNKVFASDGTFLVGSISTASSLNGNDFYSQGAIWNTSGVLQTTINLGANSDESNRDMSAGSLRDIADVAGTDYAVGFNSRSDQLTVASAIDVASPATVSYVTAYDDNDSFLNSKLTSISSSGLSIGEVKYRTPIGGAYANRLFYTDVTVAGTTLTPITFNSKFSSIFFSDANGKAGAINNNDEAVGQVDYERHQEANNGKPRAQRAFIAPLSSANAKAPLNNKAWYLDDLTYGGNDGNKYRIIDASDINDSGVIAATAYYCSSGYANDAINASCGDTLSIVAVKLVPINADNNPSIQTRPVIEDTIERQGASLGFLALTLLGFLGFRRK